MYENISDNRKSTSEEGYGKLEGWLNEGNIKRLLQG